MNFLGMDVSDLDVGAFLSLIRLVYIALSVTWIYASFRWRNRSVALLGLLALITLPG